MMQLSEFRLASLQYLQKVLCAESGENKWNKTHRYGYFPFYHLSIVQKVLEKSVLYGIQGPGSVNPAVLGIRDILVRIRIGGSVPLTNGSGSSRPKTCGSCGSGSPTGGIWIPDTDSVFCWTRRGIIEMGLLPYFRVKHATLPTDCRQFYRRQKCTTKKGATN
jgi:hypothetical protein